MSDLFTLSSYDYILPEDRIAQVPASPADTSKLLVREADGTVRDTVFHSLPQEIASDRVMFFNDSKVIRSRIVLSGAKLVTKDGREKVFDGEIFFLEEMNSTSLTPNPSSSSADLWPLGGERGGYHAFKAMVYPGDFFPVGWTVYFQDIAFRVEEVVYEGRMLSLAEKEDPEMNSGWRRSIWEILELYGQLPLPPYIEYSKEKEEGYQSIFAERRGSLAAPTASLHFTQRVLNGLEEKGIEQHTITLHVGLGTFKNIYEEDIRDYVMHAERAEVPVSIFETIANRKMQGKTILAMGTTVTRTLESLPYLWQLVREKIACSPETREFWDTRSLGREPNPLSSVSFSLDGKTLFFSSALFIYGEYSFQVVDEIITNFHLPKSTLFILVSSFLGLQNAQALYSHAVRNTYRFFSFGDAMYLKKRER